MKKSPQHIIFFDGVCILCNSTVDFIIQRDKHKVFFFAPLQGKTAHNLIPHHTTKLSSLVYLREGVVLEKSSAALRIFADLGGLRKMYLAFFIFPLFLRDGVYNIIAANRYKWFGKHEQCRIPEVWLMSRFLE